MTQQNTDRIQITHVGSLPRPHDLLDLIKAKYSGEPYDQRGFDATLARSVAESVQKQAQCGIDYVTDGEFSKPGFFSYIQARLEGFEPRPNRKFTLFEREVAAFPAYYEQYFKDAMLGGAAVKMVPMVCVGPVK
jgi:5-methyltetrahydropteroyltriglutamate--homocysteine methyltransferase